jgi:hypothetical protein
MSMMADEPENLILRFMQEMRVELREVHGEQRSLLKDLKNDGNTVVLSMLAGMVHDHEQRIDKLRAGRASRLG